MHGALAMALVLAAPPEFSDVFVAGRDGYPSIRIPAVIVTRAGTVLAVAEGRARHGDQANNKLIARRSADGGRTWGDIARIADGGENCLNNPCLAQVEPSGRILLVYQQYPGDVAERSDAIVPGLDGPNIVRNLLIHSDDAGVSWSAPREVTAQTKRATVATTVASGPGIGIQLTRGPHRGRILMPFNQGPYGHWEVYAAYSDDGGETWRIGENAPGAQVTDSRGRPSSQANEVQFVELSDGSVRLNARRWAGTPTRKTAVSRDGGVTWSAIEDAPDLPDPSCNASVLRYAFGAGDDPGILLFSGPEVGGRRRGSVYLSRDDGATWPTRRLLVEGDFAYSVLTRLPDGTIGCLFETDGHNRLVFARFTLEWLTEPSD